MYPPRPKVTITHKPSGISAYCDQCRTDRGNHAKAMALLKSRLWAASQIKVDESELIVETFDPDRDGNDK